jgi:hypothetical protein
MVLRMQRCPLVVVTRRSRRQLQQQLLLLPVGIGCRAALLLLVQHSYVDGAVSDMQYLSTDMDTPLRVLCWFL